MPTMDFFRLNNQIFTSIKVQNKMDEFDEKMETYVSKISQGSRSSI